MLELVRFERIKSLCQSLATEYDFEGEYAKASVMRRVTRQNLNKIPAWAYNRLSVELAKLQRDVETWKRS